MKEQFEVVVKHLRTLQIRYGRSTDPRYLQADNMGSDGCAQ